MLMATESAWMPRRVNSGGGLGVQPIYAKFGPSHTHGNLARLRRNQSGMQVIAYGTHEHTAQ